MKQLFAILLMLCAAPVRADDLVVFAAASLKGPLDAIAADFGGVVVSYAGSGTIARQVSFGAPADVVLLANVAWMDDLVARDAVDPTTVVDFASNALVIVGQAHATPLDLTPDALMAALGEGRLAMGNTASVPAGIYGKAALELLGLWAVAAPRLAEVENVRAALALVARGEVPLGLVYQSDARVVPDLPVVAQLPASAHPTIRYVGAAVSDDPHAKAFLAAVVAAEDTLTAAGFCPVGGCAE
ncbi:molybdate ABC transporter substrate-binding protein [Yoonia sp. 208BN28-4]|uniref:molybdate ABC transporter substrate-binding protein n=1 Tax=Yoonia sp. 208BN28-4 TaxID=3126505 RepID=UPI0030B2C127